MDDVLAWIEIRDSPVLDLQCANDLKCANDPSLVEFKE